MPRQYPPRDSQVVKRTTLAKLYRKIDRERTANERLSAKVALLKQRVQKLEDRFDAICAAVFPGTPPPMVEEFRENQA